MRKTAMLALLLPLLVAVAALAAPYTVTVTVAGPDGKPVSGALVEVFNSTGKVASATTGSNGVAQFSLNNGTYAVFATNGWVALASLKVAGNTAFTVNASKMLGVNATSTPISVTFNLTYAGAQKSLSSNVTIFVASGNTLTLTYPMRVYKGFMVYNLTRILYGSVETTNNTVTLTPTASTVVTAEYKTQWAFALEWWMVAALAAVIVGAIGVAMYFGSKTAHEAIADYATRAMRFVRRRESGGSPAPENAFVHRIGEGEEKRFRFIKRR